jgi:hypothetical protein
MILLIARIIAATILIKQSQALVDVVYLTLTVTTMELLIVMTNVLRMVVK